jgi:hypothetical protein
MLPDSVSLTSAAVLFAACIAGWWLAAHLKAAARLPLRFAAVLLSALAVAAALRMGDVAALLLLPLACAALALSALARFARRIGPLAATLALVIALACGLGALVSGYAMPALMLVMLSGLCIIAAALQALAVAAIASGMALLAMGLCFLEAGVGAGVLLFAGASVIGLSRPLARPQLLRSTSSAVRGAHLP